MGIYHTDMGENSASVQNHSSKRMNVMLKNSQIMSTKPRVRAEAEASSGPAEEKQVSRCNRFLLVLENWIAVYV